MQDKERLSILFLNSHPIQYFAPLYQEMSRRGLPIKVFYCSDETVQGYQDKEFGVQVQWDIPLLQGYDHQFLSNQSWKPGLKNGFFGLFNLSVIREIHQLPKSVIVVHGWLYASNMLVIIFGKLFGHVMCVRGDNPYHQELKKSRMIRILKQYVLKFFIFPFTDYFLFVGQQNRKFYELYDVNRKKLKFVPHAVDNRRFRKSYQEHENKKISLLKTLSLPTDMKIILFAAKYIPKKNPMNLIEAFHSLNRKDTALVMVGEGELRPQMEAYIAEHELQHVYLTGFVNQTTIEKYYTIGDVFVMCSGMGETWGLSVNEAMNFALPVILSDLTGCAEDLVEEGVNGFTFETGNTEQLAQKLKVLLDNDRLRKQMGQASQEKIKHYSYEQIISSLQQTAALQ